MITAGSPEPRSGRLAIIGAGRAGREFARRCLSAGYQVVLEDVMPANLRRAEMDLRSPGEGALAGTLELVTSVEDAVRSADLAVDFVPDELESKLEIFCMIDRMAPPRTILLTPSDALSIADLASCTYRPDRCFAVRGLRERKEANSAPVRLTVAHPVAVDSAALLQVSSLLDRLQLPYTTTVDRMPSLLAGR